MAASKKASPVRAKPKSDDGGAGTGQRDTEVTVTISIGGFHYTEHDHGKSKAAGNKEVKAFPAWVLTQL